jgi:hypothetical protein
MGHFIEFFYIEWKNQFFQSGLTMEYLMYLIRLVVLRFIYFIPFLIFETKIVQIFGKN